jgi:hypothetical protein
LPVGQLGRCAIHLDNAAEWPTWPAVLTDENDDLVYPEGTFEALDRVIDLDGDALIKLACPETTITGIGSEFAFARSAPSH